MKGVNLWGFEVRIVMYLNFYYGIRDRKEMSKELNEEVDKVLVFF